MPLIDDPRYTKSALVGGLRTDLFAKPPVDTATPSTLDLFGAAARSSNTLSAGMERFVLNPDPDAPDAPPGYDALDHIQGYEAHAHQFIDATNPSEVAGIKNRIDARNADEAVLQRSGWSGTGARLLMGITDPSFLAAMAVPELNIAKGLRVSRFATEALRGAAAGTSYETQMNALQDGERTLKQSLINIGSVALLNGTLGAAIRGRVSAADLKPMAADAESLSRGDVNPSGASTAGAAAAGRDTTLAQEGLARGGLGTLKTMSMGLSVARTDLQRIMASDSKLARSTLQGLDDVQLLEKNFEGLPSEAPGGGANVTSRVAKDEAQVADFVDLYRKQFAAYRQRVPADEQMTREDFNLAVADAGRNNDVHSVPEVQSLAQAQRQIFDEHWNLARKLAAGEGKDLPEGVIGSQTYFRRMYDREKIRRNLAEWTQGRMRFAMSQGLDQTEARAVAEDLTSKIMGLDNGRANYGVEISVPQAGPLKERTWPEPDETLKGFLVNDPIKVLSSYVRSISPENRITQVFGDRDMSDTIQKINDEYSALRNQAEQGPKANQKSAALLKQQQDVVQALERVRDRIYGRANLPAPGSGELGRGARALSQGWRNIVASAKLGATALISAVQDGSHIVARYGFARTMQKLTQLASSPEFRQMSKATARRAGAAVEVAMARRAQLVAEGVATDGWTEKMAQGVYKYTGLNHWTDFGRMLSATLLEDRVLQMASKAASGEELHGFAATHLASLGLDSEALKAVAAEAAVHGGETGGVRVSGSASWKDAHLQDLYDGAILQESRRLVMQPGAADRVWWMDKEVGKFVGQLKAFNIASPIRYTMLPVQMAAHGEYGQLARWIGSIGIGSYLVHVFRSISAGKLPDTTLTGAANQAFGESGLGGEVPDLLAAAGRRVGFLGESARYSDRNVTSVLGGPAIGFGVDLWDLAYNRTQGGISASDLHALRRMLPYQNVWYLRRAINALEGETAEGLGLDGATNESVAQRLLETTPLQSGSQGGTLVEGHPVQ